MNYMKRLERLWKIQAIIGDELSSVLALEDPSTALKDISPQAKVLVNKIHRVQQLCEKA